MGCRGVMAPTIEVDLANAESRNPRAKQEIDAKIEEAVGFEEANRLIQEALHGAFWSLVVHRLQKLVKAWIVGIVASLLLSLYALIIYAGRHLTGCGTQNMPWNSLSAWLLRLACVADDAHDSKGALQRYLNGTWFR